MIFDSCNKMRCVSSRTSSKVQVAPFSAAKARIRTQPQPGSSCAQSSSTIHTGAVVREARYQAYGRIAVGRARGDSRWLLFGGELMQTAVSTGMATRAPLSQGGCQWQGASTIHLDLHRLLRHQRRRTHQIPSPTSFSGQPFSHSLQQPLPLQG
jgi:hypothetical protein